MLGKKEGKRLYDYVPNYVVFDLETTGLNVKKDAVIEISAVRVRGQEIVDEFTTLVNPCRPIAPGASRVNGITDEMVEDAPTFDIALAEFMDFAQDEVLIGHNIANFDIKILNRDAKNYWNKIVTNDYLDTLSMARMHLPQLKHHRLVDVAMHYGISTQGAHRALNDCKMTQQVFERLSREC